MPDTLSPAFPAFNSNKLAWVAGVGAYRGVGAEGEGVDVVAPRRLQALLARRVVPRAAAQVCSQRPGAKRVAETEETDAIESTVSNIQFNMLGVLSTKPQTPAAKKTREDNAAAGKFLTRD